MNKEEIFAHWAPAASPWSRWAKPVLFAHLGPSNLRVFDAGVLPSVDWAPAAKDKTAIVLDLPSEKGVWMGLALARRGFRPVPLYNAIPAPSLPELERPEVYQRWVAVDVRPIMGALWSGALPLETLSLPDQAPPVFLLDYDRGAGGRNVSADAFDNRSVCFTTDFPSANFLTAHQIEQVLLVQPFGDGAQPDLAHSLRRWQEGGILLKRMNLDSPGIPRQFEIPRPSWFGMMFQRTLATLNLRRAKGGGFGNWLPESGGGGG